MSIKTAEVSKHVKVHKVLRHKKIPFRVYGQLYSAVNNCKTTIMVLDKLMGKGQKRV